MKRSLYSKTICSLMSLTVTAQPLFAAPLRSPAAVENAKPLTVEQILTNSSSGKLQISNARLITDNDESFQTKMAIVKAAKESLYLTYYIYANDYSSSLFNAALIEKARSGTKIRLLVDFITNYSRMDLFRMLEAAGGGNIEVRFYNKPSAGIQKIALFAVVGCSPQALKSAETSACDNEKRAKVAAIEAGAKAGDPRSLQAIHASRLFLAGYYAKSKTALQVAAVGGQELDVDYVKSVIGKDKAQKQDILGLVKSGTEYHITGSLSDGMAARKFSKALGDLTGENINLATGVLPINEIQKDPQLKKEYDHWTDYTHQKLIIAEVGNGKFIFQTGGRNIEDSYHLKTNLLGQLKEKQKYLFRDTDFYGEVASGGEGIAKAFLRNWDFKDMVGNHDEVNQLAPFDLPIALSVCSSDSPEFKQCVGQVLQTAIQTPEVLKQKAQERVMGEMKNMQEKAQAYMTKYGIPLQSLPTSTKISFRGMGQSDALSAADLSQSTITFIENLNMPKDGAMVRTFGTTSGNEAKDGKYISELWLKGMQNACALNKPTQVILHSAYLMMPSNMVRTVGKMIDGTWDCRNVELKIVTNSFATTDLNVINILAQSQLQAIFQRAALSKSDRKAKFSYFEYTRPEGQNQSLHTKLSVLGDDMIVGSANADIRSYYMDSNTGVYIHNAPDLARDYRKHIDDLVADGTIVDKTSSFGSMVNGKMVFANYRESVAQLTAAVVDYWIGRSSIAKRESIEKAMAKYAKFKRFALSFTDRLSNEIYTATNTIMAPPALDDVKAIFGAVKKCKERTREDKEAMRAIKKQVREEIGHGSSREQHIINQTIADACEEKIKMERVQSVDPAFNLKFEVF